MLDILCLVLLVAFFIGLGLTLIIYALWVGLVVWWGFMDWVEAKRYGR